MRKWLLIATFFFAAPLSAEVVSLNQFSGLNTDDSPLNLQQGFTPDSENVVTDEGPGVQGRKGFIRFSTEPANGLWEFPLSNGTRYILTKSGSNLKAATSDGVFDVLVSTVPSDRVIAAAVLGDRFYFADTLNGLKYWDGSSVVVASGALTVDKLVTWKGRLAASGKTGATRAIYLSKYLDGTSWAAPTNPSDDDASIITVTGSLDENIQALYASFQDKLIWFKSNSFGGIYGSRRSNFLQRTFSERIGVSSPETIQDCDGKLRWLGANRIVWEFDGATFYKISELVDDLFATISQGDTAAKSSIVTSQSDWANGSSTPSGSANSGIVLGSIVLSTHAAKSQADTEQTDFTSGTVGTYISATRLPGALVAIPSASGLMARDAYSGDTTERSFSCGSTSEIDQVFLATSTFDLYSVTFRLKRTGSPGTFRFGIWNGSGGSFSARTTPISSTTVNIDSVLSIGVNTNYPVNFGSTAYVPLLSGTTYHIVVERISGTCDGSNFLSWWQGSSTSFGACTINGSGSSTSMNYKVNKADYGATATFTSRAFDVGYSSTDWTWKWDTVVASVTAMPGCGTYDLAFYTSPDDVSYSYQTGATESNTLNLSAIAPARYAKYRIDYYYVGCSTLTKSFEMYHATITTQQISARRSTYTTAAIDIGNLISAWGPISHNGSTNGGNYTVQFGTSSNGTDFTYSNFTNNSTPAVSTAPYAKFKIMFDVDVGTDAPQVNDITLNWTDGSGVRAASAFYKQRYWLAVDVSSTNNNRILLYDKRNQWQRYTSVNADAMTIFNSNLYFGNSLGVFQAESGYTDNGIAISAYYRTPTLAPGRLDLYNNYDALWMTTDTSDSTLTNTFQINGIASDYSLGSSQMNGTSGLQNLKFPFPMSEVQQGKYINFKWSVSGSSFWRILNGSVYFQPSMIPE